MGGIQSSFNINKSYPAEEKRKRPFSKEQRLKKARRPVVTPL